jgi:predicted amino acid dehydrogenase
MPHRSRFAFLVHPRTDVAADMAMINPLLGLVPSSVYESAMARLPLRPWVQGTIRVADAPKEVLGELIAVPLSPRQLLGPDRKLVQRRIDAAVDFAIARGAEIVGLGALTAPATSGGAQLRKRTDVGVTNGNAFTAAATARSIGHIARGLPHPPVVAFVGATGSVGTAAVRAIAKAGFAAELVLVGRTPARLAALASDLGASAHWSTDLADCRRADIVVLMTSAADAVLGSEHLKLGAIVVDDTQPRNTSPDLVIERPDVVVIDGGLVSTPGLLRRGPGIGLHPDLSFACLAETALLALDGHRGHGTIGRPSTDQVEGMDRLADKYAHLGFGLAAPTSFGAPIEVAGWNAPSPTGSGAEDSIENEAVA